MERRVETVGGVFCVCARVWCVLHGLWRLMLLARRCSRRQATASSSVVFFPRKPLFGFVFRDNDPLVTPPTNN
jgi:hypothetical protein